MLTTLPLVPANHTPPPPAVTPPPSLSTLVRTVTRLPFGSIPSTVCNPASRYHTWPAPAAAPMSSLPFDGILAMTRFVAGGMRSTSAPRWVTTQIEPKPLAMSPGESAVPTVAATYRGGVGELGVEPGVVGGEVVEFTGLAARVPPPLLQPPTDDAATAASRATATVCARAVMTNPPPTADSRGLRRDRAAVVTEGLPAGGEKMSESGSAATSHTADTP